MTAQRELSAGVPLNYRHAFHAGNFADVVKHAALLQLLARLPAAGPRWVLDTHAGRAIYDLASAEARRSGEAETGAGALWRAAATPAALGPLADAVRALNPDGRLALYPGSPWLIARALAPRDRLVACELRPEEAAALVRALAPWPNAQGLQADGFGAVAERLPARGEALALIDPPFERDDDYARIVQAVRQATRRNPACRLMIWLPLKDLDTFDRFLSELAEVAPASLVAETRLRPLSDPLRMNGCALVFVSPPAGLEAPLSEICGWVAETAGDGAGEARVYAG
jgi:23S rRNA (adenine2030-N6)-methyltransferase